MGSKIEKPPAPKTVDVTKPWRRQFFECKEIGKEPPLNTSGFWKKPVHGLPMKEGK
jgi:hypothetical protein